MAVPEFIPRSGACLVSKNVVGGAGRVRWMVRENSQAPADNGWRIFSHIDTSDYLADAANLQILPFNDVCAIEPALIGIYDLPVGSDLQIVDEGAGITIVHTATGRPVSTPDASEQRSGVRAEEMPAPQSVRGPARRPDISRSKPQALVEWEERVPQLISELLSRAGKSAGLLDFSVGSLATVAHLAVEDADRGHIRPTDHGRAKAAYVAYLGEVALRAGGGEWGLVSVDDDPLAQGNRLVGRPFVERRDSSGAARVLVPGSAVDRLVVTRSAEEVVETVRRYAGEQEPVPVPVADPRLSGRADAHLTDAQAESFQVWFDEMPGRLAALEVALAPQGWTGGYTRESLVGLERLLLDRWPDHETFLAEPDGDFVDGATRYIGETYLRVGGGEWFIDHAPTFIFSGRPVVRSGRESRTPVSPVQLISSALHRRSGTVLASIWDAQSRASGGR